MIRHIALFRFNDDATAEQRQTVVDALRTLSGVVPSIRGYEVSTTLGLVPRVTSPSAPGRSQEE